MATRYLTLFAAATLCLTASAFAPPSKSCTAPSSSGALSMAPKWNGEKWVPTSPDEEPSAGYGPGKTLLLHGPKPFLNRVFQKNDYEQAVLKFMAQDKVGRIEGQGNMDAYLANPNDWAFNRMEMEKRGTKYNYTTLDKDQLIKTLIWAGIVLGIGPFYAYFLFKDYLP